MDVAVSPILIPHHLELVGKSHRSRNSRCGSGFKLAIDEINVFTDEKPYVHKNKKSKAKNTYCYHSKSENKYERLAI